MANLTKLKDTGNPKHSKMEPNTSSPFYPHESEVLIC